MTAASWGGGGAFALVIKQGSMGGGGRRGIPEYKFVGIDLTNLILGHLSYFSVLSFGNVLIRRSTSLLKNHYILLG